MRSGNIHVVGDLIADSFSASTDYTMTQYEYENNFLVHCDLADGFGAGTCIQLWKLNL